MLGLLWAQTLGFWDCSFPGPAKRGRASLEIRSPSDSPSSCPCSFSLQLEFLALTDSRLFFLGVTTLGIILALFLRFPFFSPNFVSCPNRKTKQSQEGSPSGGAVGRATIFRSFPAVFSGCGHNPLDLRRSGSSLENPFFHGKSTLLPHRNTGPDPSLG